MAVPTVTNIHVPWVLAWRWPDTRRNRTKVEKLITTAVPAEMQPNCLYAQDKDYNR